MNNTKKILALDIGITTGAAILEYNAYTIPCVINLSRVFIVPDDYIAWHTLIRRSREEEIRLAVYEEFRSSVHNASIKRAIEITGAFKFSAFMSDIEIFPQYPSQRKGYLTIAKNLVNAKFDVLKEHEPHIIDAVAHGLRYLNKEVHIDVRNSITE